MWDSQSHKGRPIFGGWHKSFPNGSCGIGFAGFTTFVKFKMEEAWNSIVRWGPLGCMAISGRGCWSVFQVAPHGILLVPRASLCTVARNRGAMRHLNGFFNSVPHFVVQEVFSFVENSDGRCVHLNSQQTKILLGLRNGGFLK